MIARIVVADATVHVGSRLEVRSSSVGSAELGEVVPVFVLL
jgi:hypothetical protein